MKGCDEGVEQRRMSTTRTEAETVAGRRLPLAIRLLRIGPKPIVMLQASRRLPACRQISVADTLPRLLLLFAIVVRIIYGGNWSTIPGTKRGRGWDIVDVLKDCPCRCHFTIWLWLEHPRKLIFFQVCLELSKNRTNLCAWPLA